MKNIILLFFISIICTACFPDGSVNKPSVSWTAIDGNKAGATVKLACTYNVYFESPGSYSNANTLAAEKCRIWGYGTAKAFGGIQERCADLQCNVKIAEVVYQCIGDKKEYDLEQERKKKERAEKEEYYKKHPEKRPSIFQRVNELGKSGELNI